MKEKYWLDKNDPDGVEFNTTLNKVREDDMVKLDRETLLKEFVTRGSLISIDDL